MGFLCSSADSEDTALPEAAALTVNSLCLLCVSTEKRLYLPSPHFKLDSEVYMAKNDCFFYRLEENHLCLLLDSFPLSCFWDIFYLLC